MNYTDYFSYGQTFIALEGAISEKGFNKARFRPKRIILGGINAYSGNTLVRGLLDNHPSILMISNFNLFDNNLFWICVQLADVPMEKILPLFKSMYQPEDLSICKIEAFEEKLEELLEVGERYTSQELFVIFMIAYVYMYGREIDDVRDMLIYWEPHNSGDLREKFLGWLGMEEGLCGIINVVRNTCMKNGSMIRGDFGQVEMETLLVHSLVYSKIHQVNQGGFERVVVRFEDLKLNPREKLSELCKYWGILWSETLMKTTEYGKRAGYGDGHQKIYDFDLKPVYNNYEEYFSSFDRFRFTLICSPWQKNMTTPM